ncbi:MAG: carboxypeptidase-like regulatory domain-containing protein, partial [Candidatus Acidiferrales bacterium]
RISGRATSTLANAMLMVMAVPRNPDTATPVDPMHLMARPDSKTGAFTIEGVPAGSYKVVASSIVFAGDKVRTAIQDVDVVNADVDSVSLVVSRGVDVSGRVAFEGQAAASARNLRVSIRGRDEDFAFGSQQEEDVEKEGSFTLTGLGDGTYTIRINSKCDECYTKSATASGTNLLETGLVVQSGQAPGSIEIVYSSNTGKAAGTVTGADDLPAPGSYVMLVLASGVRDTEDNTKSATTDQYGRFEIRGVPPRHYKALAWAKMDSGSTDDPEFVKPFLAKADSLEVTTGATAALQLKAIPTSAIEPSN